MKISDERSYGGYTDDFSSCERCTLKELKEEGGFHEYFNEPLGVLKMLDVTGTWIVHVDDLVNIGKFLTRYAVR